MGDRPAVVSRQEKAMKSRCKTQTTVGKKRECVIGISPNPWGPLLSGGVISILWQNILDKAGAWAEARFLNDLPFCSLIYENHRADVTVNSQSKIRNIQ